MSMHIPWAHCSKGALHFLEALNSGTGRLAHASLDLCKNLREKHHLYRVCQPLSSLVCRHIHQKMSRVHASSKCSYRHTQIQTLWKFLLLNLIPSKTLEVWHKTAQHLASKTPSRSILKLTTLKRMSPIIILTVLHAHICIHNINDFFF